MHQNPTAALQTLLDELDRPGKLAKEVLILDIIHLDTAVLEPVPILEVFKIIAQH